MADRYPGYDVLAKRDTPSWNDKTRAVIAERLGLDGSGPRFLNADAWRTLVALADHVVPQPAGRPPIPIAAMVDAMLLEDSGDGFRHADMPKPRGAWTRGLAAIEAEAWALGAQSFAALSVTDKDKLLAAMRDGHAASDAWGDMPPKMFFIQRLIGDLVTAYYAHPSAWSAIGFGGPASPRGYVRLEPGIQDPWEATEAYPGRESRARRANRRVG